MGATNQVRINFESGTTQARKSQTRGALRQGGVCGPGAEGRVRECRQDAAETAVLAGGYLTRKGQDAPRRTQEGFGRPRGSEVDGCHPAMVCSLTRVRTTAGYPGVVVGGGDQAVFAGITVLGLQQRVAIKRAMAVVL